MEKQKEQQKSSSFAQEIARLGWKEVPNPDKNNGWREFVGAGLPIAFNNVKEEDILRDLRALTPINP